MRANEDLDSLDQSIKKLRVSYEKYFAGVERREPTQDHKKIRDRLRRMMTEPSHNTARRFRLQSLQSTLVTYEQYWTRMCRQIEEGTLKRDKNKAQPTGASPRARTAKKQAAADAGYSDQVQTLYKAFKTAQDRVGDRNMVSIDSLARTVDKQMKIIKEKYQCKRIEFKVAVKDGKAILKAVPKNS